MDSKIAFKQATGALAMSKANVLYITYDGLTGPLGQSQIIPYLIELNQQGYQFTILSFEKRDEFSRNEQKIRNLLQANQIGWEPLTFTSKPPLLAKVYDLLRMRFTAIRLCRQHRIQLVHSRSYPAGQTALVLKRRFSCKFLFDMRGFWVDERVDGKMWDLSKPFYRMLYRRYKKIEQSLLKGADHVITLTQNGKQELVDAYGVHAEKITVIPCCVDTSFFNPANVSNSAKAELKQRLSIQPDDYILTYVGKLGTWYLLDEMLDFFIGLKKLQPKAKFLLLVDYDKQRVAGIVRERGLNPADFIIEKTDRSEVPLYLSLAQSSVFFIKPSYSKKGSSPIKLGELMAMGIPVVCNSGVGDLNLIMDDRTLGVAIDEFTTTAYEKAAAVILSQDFDPACIRAEAVADFSVVKGAEQYKSVYQGIIQQDLQPGSKF